MSYLLDTDILSLLEREVVPLKLVNWIHVNEPSIYLSEVSLAELQCGYELAPEPHKPRLHEWLTVTRLKYHDSIEPLTEGVLVEWKHLLRELKARKRTMSCEDSLIAATARHCGYIIVTRNVRHFEPSGIPTLNPLD